RILRRANVRTRILQHPILSDFDFRTRVDPRDLHSFPTRRSSDLCRPTNGAACSAKPKRSAYCSSGSRAASPRCGRTWRSWLALRSEEHTSELQSLRHLVCRLLLEKKKTRHTMPQLDMSP